MGVGALSVYAGFVGLSDAFASSDGRGSDAARVHHGPGVTMVGWSVEFWGSLVMFIGETRLSWRVLRGAVVMPHMWQANMEDDDAS